MNTHSLKEGEDLIFVLQEHWVLTLRYFPLYLVGLFFSGVLLWFGLGLHASAPVAGSIVLLMAYLSFLITHHWFFMYLLSLELSGWAITTRRIIDFHFLPYVEHDMTYISISDVKELEKHQRGLLKNIFHYGDVEVNLAANPDSLIFHYVPYPGKFVQLILEVQKQEKHESLDLAALRGLYS